MVFGFLPGPTDPSQKLRKLEVCHLENFFFPFFFFVVWGEVRTIRIHLNANLKNFKKIKIDERYITKIVASPK